LSVAGKWKFVLRDLKSLRQVGIEVVLASEYARLSNGAIKCKCNPQGKFNSPLVDDRQDILEAVCSSA